MLKPHGIQVAHKPTSTLRKLVSNPKRPIEMSDHTHIVYKVQCANCEKFYVGQTGRKLKTRMHEHQLAVRRHDALSLISIHEDAQCHKFDFSNVQILDRAVTKGGREFLEAWYSSTNSINRHIELDNIYLPIRSKEITRPLQDTSHMRPQASRGSTHTDLSFKKRRSKSLLAHDIQQSYLNPPGWVY